MQSAAQFPKVVPSETLSRSGIVDLWCFFYQRANDAELLAAYSRLLTERETERHRGLRFERDQALFLATRALQRTVLSQYANLEPEAWRFAEGPHGKPRLAEPLPGSSLSFNLSNTDGLVVCAVSSHEDLGVDVENLQRPTPPRDIADRYFSSAETRALRALPPERQRERFFEYWVLKESYIKARGLGLAMPLDRFSFRLDERAAPSISFEPSLNDDPLQWRFACLKASEAHLIGLAVECGAAPLSLRVQFFVPLRGMVLVDPQSGQGDLA